MSDGEGCIHSDLQLPAPGRLNGTARGARIAPTRKSHFPQKLLEGSLGKRSPQRPMQTPELCTKFLRTFVFGAGGQSLTLDAHLRKWSLGNTCVNWEASSPVLRGNDQAPHGVKRAEAALRCGVLGHSFSSGSGSHPWLAVTTSSYSVPSPEPIFFLPLHICCIK